MEPENTTLGKGETSTQLTPIFGGFHICFRGVFIASFLFGSMSKLPVASGTAQQV